MRVTLIVLALLLLMIVSSARAEDPEQEVDNLVFVGRLVSIEELPNPCEGKSDCISMDALWRARYEIEQTLVGSYPEREITFSIADHYGYPPMAKFEHALLFVGLYSNGPWLHKYQGFAMHPLTGGDWGYCGGPFRATDGEPDPPTPSSLPFAGSLQVRGEPSRDELELLLGERNFSVKHGRVYCKRGVVLSDFYEVVRKGALQARGVNLPPWVEISP